MLNQLYTGTLFSTNLIWCKYTDYSSNVILEIKCTDHYALELSSMLIQLYIGTNFLLPSTDLKWYPKCTNYSFETDLILEIKCIDYYALEFFSTLIHLYTRTNFLLLSTDLIWFAECTNYSSYLIPEIKCTNYYALEPFAMLNHLYIQFYIGTFFRSSLLI